MIKIGEQLSFLQDVKSETVRFKLFKTMWSHVDVSPELYVKGEDGRVIRIDFLARWGGEQRKRMGRGGIIFEGHF